LAATRYWCRYRYDPVGRLREAQSRVGVETFAFDPASNLVDPQAQREISLADFGLKHIA
jgi:hypothetical protein